MLVITWFDNGKHNGNSSRVSLANKTYWGLQPVNLSDVCGNGGYYGDALEAFIYEFDKKLEELNAFRKMLDEQYQYQDKVRVDFFGKELKK